MQLIFNYRWPIVADKTDRLKSYIIWLFFFVSSTIYSCQNEVATIYMIDDNIGNRNFVLRFSHASKKNGVLEQKLTFIGENHHLQTLESFMFNH